MPLPSFSSDMYKLIEEKFPFGLGKPVAQALLVVFVLAIFAGAVAAVWIAVAQPVFERFRGIRLPSAGLVLPALTLILLVMAAIVVARKLRRLHVAMDVAGQFIDRHGEQLKDMQSITQTVDVLDQRLRALELSVFGRDIVKAMVQLKLQGKIKPPEQS